MLVNYLLVATCFKSVHTYIQLKICRIMETKTEPMTPLEKLHRLLEVKKEAERDAVERFQNDPRIRAVYERLRAENAERSNEL